MKKSITTFGRDAINRVLTTFGRNTMRCVCIAASIMLFGSTAAFAQNGAKVNFKKNGATVHTSAISAIEKVVFNNPAATVRYETVPYTPEAVQHARQNSQMLTSSEADNLDNLVFYDYGDHHNYYFFVLGHVNTAPLAYRPAIYYNGVTPITVGYSSSNVTQQTIANSVSEAYENSVSKDITTTWGNNVGVTAGVETSVSVPLVSAVKIKFEASYGHSWGGSESQNVTTARSFSNTYETSNTKASEITDAISVTIGPAGEPAGLYRFSLFSVTDVYFVMITNRAKTQLIDTYVSYCARPTQFWALDYEPDQMGSFGKTAVGDLLQIPNVEIADLPDIAECVHQWNSWIVTTPATALTEGEETRTCNICGRTQTRVVPVIITGTFNLGARVWASDTGNATYNSSTATLTVNDGARIAFSSSVTNIRIVVNGNAVITMRNNRIENVHTDYGSPIVLNTGANLTLRLEGTNDIFGAPGYAGIRTTGATLTIADSPGSLRAVGGNGLNGKVSVINGNTESYTNAYGGGAGIGGNGALSNGSVGDDGGTVIIKGGTVTAQGGRAGDGVSGTTVNVGSLTVIVPGAGGGGAGAGIGGGGGRGTAGDGSSANGNGGAGGNITIYAGATVTANGGSSGANGTSNNPGFGGGQGMSYGGGAAGSGSYTNGAQDSAGTINDQRNP